MGYLNGKVSEPALDDSYDKWEAENSMIMSWLLHYMLPKISYEYFLRTTKEVWGAAAQTYSKMGNGAQIYELMGQIHGRIKGDWYVVTYFHKLYGLLQELDHYQNLQTKCVADAITIRKMIEEEPIYEFLAGLNSEYDPVFVQILGKDPLSSLREVFSHVQNVASRHSTSLHSSSNLNML
jgi:hypothetical protein